MTNSLLFFSVIFVSISVPASVSVSVPASVSVSVSVLVSVLVSIFLSSVSISDKNYMVASVLSLSLIPL